MNLDPNLSLEETLGQAAAQDTRVELRLLNGQTLGGKVGGVSSNAVVIAEITGKEFFDAYVRLDHITAIDVRARNA